MISWYDYFQQTYVQNTCRKSFCVEQLTKRYTIIFFEVEMISSHILIKRTSVFSRLSTSFVCQLFSATFVICHSKNTIKKYFYLSE